MAFSASALLLENTQPNLLGMERGGREWAQDSQMDWMGGRTDGLADYIHIEDRARWLLQFLKIIVVYLVKYFILRFREITVS